MNAIQILHLYRYSGTWVFNDDKHGLYQEPFVSGAPKILDLFLQSVGQGDEDEMRLLFSKLKFPGSVLAVRHEKESGGYWYKVPEFTGMAGWLCPATLCYFTSFPETFHFKVEVIE